jgi:cbb3-type cytochrome oxidase cytochrome c subunit
MTTEVALIGLAGTLLTSLIGNAYQYFSNKRGKDLDAIKKEIELLQQLQATKDKAYEEALRVKDLQIQQLTDEVKAQTELIEKNTAELKRMQKIVTFLIGNGCQEASTCNEHCPYSMEDLEKLITGE